MPYPSMTPDPNTPVVRRARPTGKPRLAVSSWQRGHPCGLLGLRGVPSPNPGGKTARSHGCAMV